jgi:hypothetical protein
MMDAREQRRFRGIRDVPDLMAAAAEDPQHVDLRRIALGHALAIPQAHHLRAALFRRGGHARSAYQPTIHKQGNRYIAYIGFSLGRFLVLSK